MKRFLLLYLVFISFSFAGGGADCLNVFIPAKFRQSLSTVEGGAYAAKLKIAQKNAYNYLNDSVDNWFRNSNTRSAQNCLSCHTSLPYMMINAAETALSRKQFIRDLIETRTKNFERDGFVAAENIPWYQLDKSYSTEVVVNASSLVMAEKLAGSNGPLSDLAQRSYNLMWKRQKPDGSFEWLDHFGLRPYESQNAGYWGTSMAAVMGGYVESQASPQLTKSFKYLADNFKEQSVHNQIFSLWANAKAPGGRGFLPQADVDKLLKKIKSKQNPDGGWSQDFILGTGITETDPYATAIIAFVLKNSKTTIPNEAAVKNFLLDSFEKSSTVSVGTRNMTGSLLSVSPNRQRKTTFFSDMATSYGLMYLGK